MSWSECRSAFRDPSRCKAWCFGNPGWCDEGAKAYCETAPGDPFCACARAGSPGENPGCFDRACIERGYQSSDTYRPDCTFRCAGAEKEAGTDPAAFAAHCGRPFAQARREAGQCREGFGALGPAPPDLALLLLLALVVLGLCLGSCAGGCQVGADPATGVAAAAAAQSRVVQ